MGFCEIENCMEFSLREGLCAKHLIQKYECENKQNEEEAEFMRCYDNCYCDD
jgi:hypothetical protein